MEHVHRPAFSGVITRMTLNNTLSVSRRNYGRLELREPKLLAFRTRFGTPILVKPRDEVLGISPFRNSEGEEYSVVVIAIGETPVPLIPQQAKYHQVSGYARFLTLDLKFHAKSDYELLRQNDDPELYRHLQRTAVEAFAIKGMRSNNMGCDVYVIEVDQLPVFFYPAGSQLEDTDVKLGFSGGYRAIINTYITNYLLKHPVRWAARSAELAELNDTLASHSDSVLLPVDAVTENAFNFSCRGTVIDIGYGSPALGRILKASHGTKYPT